MIKEQNLKKNEIEQLFRKKKIYDKLTENELTLIYKIAEM